MKRCDLIGKEKTNLIKSDSKKRKSSKLWKLKAFLMRERLTKSS